jgi:hypothetical protein
MTGDGSDDAGDPWNLVPRDELAALTLDEVLALVGRRAIRDDDPALVIAIRVAPVGFRAIMGHLARERHMSFSRLALLTAWHGVAKLEGDSRVQLLRQTYEATRSAAMDSGDRDALAQLNQNTPHDFQHSQAIRTTIAAPRALHARLGDLAMVCGIPLPRVAIYAILESTLTLENSRKYREVLLSEMAAFMRHVEYRNRVLRLGL